MRVMRWLGAVAGLWLAGGILGALAALGPSRWADEVTVGSVAAGVGVAALLAALVLLLRRHVHGRLRTVLVAVAGVVVVAIAAMPVGVAVWATHPPHADFEGPGPEGSVDVTIEAGDGITLAGWYVPTGNGAAVVLGHGAGSTRDDVVRQSEVLADAGYGVLAIDARGHGQSTGQAMDLGWWGEADLSAAFDTLTAFDGVDPDRVGLVGMSMGGEESLGAAGVDSRVRAVVAEGATQRTAADKSGWLPRHPLGWLQRAMDAERDLLVSLLTDAPRPASLSDAVAASDAPVLLITASQMPDEAAAAKWIKDANPRVEIWTVPDAGHIGGIATA
ncbi:MAG: hypothetical protein CVT68_12300, partial [Actinobacteria bacterium HGW-Actinobacteria-8]